MKEQEADDEFAVDAEDDEDHTVTARFRAQRAQRWNCHHHFCVTHFHSIYVHLRFAHDIRLSPPTASVFSVPHSMSTHSTVGQNSVATYTSTLHILASGAKLTGLPPSPLIYRELIFLSEVKQY